MGSLTGKGEERVSVKWEDGSSYEGDLLDGKFHGQGVYVWPNGDKFSESGKTVKKTVMGVSQDLMDLFLSVSSVMMFPTERVFTLDRTEQLFQKLERW